MRAHERACKAWILALVFLLRAPCLQANVINLPSVEEFEWKLSDDPWAAYNWAAEAYAKLTPEDPPQLRVRTAGFFISTITLTAKLDDTEKYIPQIEAAWKTADELSMHEDRASLGLELAVYFRLMNQIAKSNAFFVQAIDEARRSKDHNALIQLLSNYGRMLDEDGNPTESLKHLSEALLLANDDSLKVKPLLRHLARLSAAVSLPGFEKNIDASMKFLIDNRGRYFLAVWAYNAGGIFRQSDPDKALGFYDLAFNSARTLNDSSTMGAALAEQARIANERGLFALGERKAAEAAHTIGERDKQWLGRALYVQAYSLWKLKRPKEALAIVQQALSLIPKEKTARILAYEVQAAVQEDLNLHKDAMETYKTLRELESRLAEEMKEENFAKARVELGLQMEEQKNQLLQKENELQVARLKTSRYLLIAAIALGILLLGAVASTIWALSNARKIQKAREKIQIILDVIEEGILTINGDLRPEPEYSRYLTRLYPGLFQKDEDAIDWLFPTEMLGQERQSIIRETLRACLGEESLAWDLNSGQLPSEIILPGEIPRSIHILWQPLLSSEERIKGFLLSLRDISDQKRLQDEVILQKEKSKALEQRVQELLLTRFQDARRLIETLEARLEGPEEIWLEAASKRDLHTRKGEARTLGLKGLSEAIHSLESALSERNAEVISHAITVLRDETGAYQSLMRDMFMSRSTGKESPTSLMDVVAPLLPALRKQFKEGGIPVRSIDASDGVDEWPADVLDAVRQSLLHALSNSADHGYILPSKRGQKLSPAVLRVEAATESSGKIQVRVRDFGAGLNMEKLKAMAEEKGFRPGPDETVADIVFLDGATTAETASATSGRGVGLSAVRQLCRDLKGDAHLLANDQGQGSLLVMSFAGSKEQLKKSA